MTANPTRETLTGAADLVSRSAVVAVDGPAGSGKSTTARAIARRYGLTYVDTGAMYRAVTRAALSVGIDPADGERLGALLDASELRLEPGDREARVLWDGRDVSQAIRAPEVDAAVSAVAAHPEVRARMVERQRVMGRRGGVVMEGRDIGSVVFPLATTKIYLDASLEARADRRWRQERERGRDADREAVRADLAARDRRDSERTESPLLVSPDAHVLDTSDWTLAQQLDEAALACRINPWLDARVDWDAPAAWRAMPAKYRLAYGVFRIMGDLLGLRVVGRPAATVPPRVILASNHVSWFDPPVVGGTIRRSPLRTIAKRELFAGPLLNAAFRWLDAIPIDRRGFDARAFRAGGEALAGGASLFFFPEGTRRPPGRPGPVKGGLGLLALATGAPVLPIHVRGTHALAWGGNPDVPLEVRYGPLVRMHALKHLAAAVGRRVAAERVGTLFQTILEELLARSYAETPPGPRERELAGRARDHDRHARPFA